MTWLLAFLVLYLVRNESRPTGRESHDSNTNLGGLTRSTGLAMGAGGAVAGMGLRRRVGRTTAGRVDVATLADCLDAGNNARGTFRSRRRRWRHSESCRDFE